MTGSLAYRQNTAAILRGDVPEKYLRIMPHIPGDRILEAGSAEGVLACLMAKQGKRVTALEANAGRNEAAKELHRRWLERGFLSRQAQVDFVHGRLEDSLPGEFDTLVAVRMVYYLRERIDDVFAEVALRIPNVVLCGNKGRAKRYHAGNPDQPLGEFNYYASAEGMRDLLERHGYKITKEVADGDAIVVGSRT